MPSPDIIERLEKAEGPDRERRICVRCSAEYWITPIGKTKRQRFCSHRCANDNTAERRRTDEARRARNFWKLVDSSGGPDACWPMRRPSAEGGHCRIVRDGKHIGAHRYALTLSVGGAPEGLPFACHNCDNPACCNPAHLRWGSAADNMLDRFERTTWHHPGKKLDVEEAERLKSAGLTNLEIGNRLGVSHGTVGRAFKRKADQARRRELLAKIGENVPRDVSRAELLKALEVVDG